MQSNYGRSNYPVNDNNSALQEKYIPEKTSFPDQYEPKFTGGIPIYNQTQPHSVTFDVQPVNYQHELETHYFEYDTPSYDTRYTKVPKTLPGKIRKTSLESKTSKSSVTSKVSKQKKSQSQSKSKVATVVSQQAKTPDYYCRIRTNLSKMKTNLS